MKKTFKYRIYPTKKQQTALMSVLDGCRFLYNKGLEIKINTYKESEQSLSKYEMINKLPSLKTETPFLGNIHSQVLQNVFTRLDLAFKGFFRRVKSGDTPGFPRFRNKFRYDSFTYPQRGFKITDKGKLSLSKIGVLKMVYHRSVQGKIKTCTIRRSSTGKWWATFCCDEVVPVVLEQKSSSVGIDLGISNFAVFSNGKIVDNPKFSQSEYVALAKQQRKLSKLHKGSTQRNTQRKRVARVHERIGFKRDDFFFKTAKNIVSDFGNIFLEDLNIKSMISDKKRLNRGIIDSSWGRFLSIISFKAEEAGRRLLLVNPRNTSQTCSECGALVKKSLAVRTHRCQCGYVADRDLNAARNIHSLGLQTVGCT